MDNPNRTWNFGYSVTLALACAMTGCGEQERTELPADLPSTEISLGPVVMLDPTPAAVVGGAKDQQPGHALHRVRDALILESGGLAVADEGSQSILFFDSVGNYIGRVGRSGDGPGEFRRIRSLHMLPGDTMAAWDAAARRITLLDPQRDVVSTISSDENGGGGIPSRFADMEMHGLVARNFVHVFEAPTWQAPDGFSREPLYVGIRDRAGAIESALGPLPGTQYFRGGGAMPAQNGYRFHIATRHDAFYIGDGRGRDLIEYGPESTPIRRIRLPIDRAYQEPSLLRSIHDEFLETRVGPGNRATIREMLEQGTAVDSFPSFVAMESGGDALWVELSGGRDDSSHWLVVRPASGTAHPIQLPPDAAVLAAGPWQGRNSGFRRSGASGDTGAPDHQRFRREWFDRNRSVGNIVKRET